jgi:hypothetical protein
MMDGPPYSRAAAIAVARELCETLAPFCVRIALAGSLRRGKHAVSDVELLYISQVVDQPADLFSSKLVALADLEIDKLLDAGLLAKRRNKAGAFAWASRTSSPCIAQPGSPWTSSPRRKKTGGTT